MKKLIIIAVASSFLFISCAKVDPTPNSQNITVARVDPNPAPPQPHCFILTNTETNAGPLEYRLGYVDCDNVYHNAALAFGESITICLKHSVVTTNFSYTLKDIGVC